MLGIVIGISMELATSGASITPASGKLIAEDAEALPIITGLHT